MPINQFIPTQAPGLGQTPTGAGLGAYSQAIQNAFMSPLLQQQLAQQQQQTQQMTAATPFAGQIAQNEALRLLPMNAIAQIMENPRLLALYPWLGNELGGFMGGQFNRSLPPPFGTVPTPLTTRGATTSPTSPTGAPIPTQQQPTWYGNLGKDISGAATSLGKVFGASNSSNASQSSAPITTQNSSTVPQINTKTLNIPSSNAFQTAGQPAPNIPDIAAQYAVQQGLSDLKPLPGGRYIGRDKNGKYHTFG